MDEYDIIIVGAGPAGIFAAYELIKLSKEQKRLSQFTQNQIPQNQLTQNQFTQGQQTTVSSEISQSSHLSQTQIYPETPYFDSPQLKQQSQPSQPPLKICLIERGNSITQRQKQEVMCGVGGAGTFSDGKLHFTPVLSHEKMLDLFTVHEYQAIIDYVDQILTDFGVDSEYFPKNMEQVKGFVEDCKRNSIHLYVRKIRHAGSDVLPKIIFNFENFLVQNGIEMKTLCEVKDILVEGNGTERKCIGVITKNNERIMGKKILLAPGRYNIVWMQELAKRYDVGYTYEKIEVGVRVEFPESVMRKYAEVMYEAIFSIRTHKYDDLIRTFCPCPGGMVAIEEYEGFVCVNGHSNSTHRTNNSNFAFLSEIMLTEPVENTVEYARSIAQLATTIGGGKPILQRLGDLRRGRRSTWARINKSYVEPTLKEVTPGDISMALPHRTVMNIIEGLEQLDAVMPGINSPHTLLYAPELKFRSSKIKTKRNLETSVKNLYVAGDGAGLSGNIVGAAATGIIAARGMLGRIN